jgi:uncharacterized membrane protein HdeD (DUF308 family)
MTYTLDPVPLPHDPVALERLRHRWGWIVFFGAVVALFGLIALGLAVWATLISVFTIAIFMIIAGGGEIGMGVTSRDWGHFFLWIIAGLFYIVAGAFALAQPFVAAAVFTLALGIAMLATGLMRIYFGMKLAKGLRGLVILAGVVSFLVGILIVASWPTNSLFILGLLLGLDLLFWGSGWIAFGLRLRTAAA